MKIKAIITGSTGMVGEGVLHECLLHPEVESVLVINRKSCGVSHPKLREIIHWDFFNLSKIVDQFAGYNACYFCAGISSLGRSEEDYRHITYDLTLNFAKTLYAVNPDMTFIYVSGSGTDTSETGKIMWARIKGKTENDLLSMFLNKSYMFRPGYIQPTKELKNTYRIYKIIAPLYPLWKLLFPKYVVTLREIGIAMINATLLGFEKKILECNDISQLSKR